MSNAYLIGAGFTKAAIAVAPLNREVLKSVVGQNPDGSALGRAWSRYGSEDIEVVLTRMDLEILEGGDSADSERTTTEDREQADLQLAAFFERFCFQEEVPWLAPFATRALHVGDVIINLNYDCFLEGLLDFHGVWSPNGGYGRIDNPLGNSIERNQKDILIHKIHGSVTFRASRFADEPRGASIDLEIDKRYFPRSGENRHFGAGINSKPYVIAPSFVKRPKIDIVYVLLDALQGVWTAQNLIVVGCGLRPEDSHLWMLITRFLRHQDWIHRRIIIVDPDASTVGERILAHYEYRPAIRDNIIRISHGFETGLTELVERLNGTSGA